MRFALDDFDDLAAGFGTGRRSSSSTPHQHGVAGGGVAGSLGRDEDVLLAIGAGSGAGGPHEAEAACRAAETRRSRGSVRLRPALPGPTR